MRPIATLRASPKLRRQVAVVAVLLLIVVLASVSATLLDGDRLSPDGIDNASLSFHLWTKGSFSEDGQTPSYVREPLPIAITAAHMALLTDIPETAAPQQLARSARYTNQLLRVNLFYLVAVLFAVWWLAWLLTRSHLAGALGILGTWLTFCQVGANSLNLLTESAAGLTLVLASAALVWLVQTKRLRAAVLAGVLLGAVALTKAAGLYVALLSMPLVAVSLALLGHVPRRRALGLLAVTAVAFVVTVAPWMTRNYLRFDDFAVAQRGGVVLYTRALKDRMSAEEYGGAFYAYAPLSLRTHVFERLLGFQERDLQPGGRYARLRRYPEGEVEVVMKGDVDRAVSYFGKAWAMNIRLREQLAAAGLPRAGADRLLQERASAMIQDAPGRHLATTLPFAWRGLWAFPFTGRSGAVYLWVVAADFLAFVTLLAFPLIAVWRRRADWFAFSVVGVGMFWFYALLTHFISRYSVPLIPLAVLSVLVVAHDLVPGAIRRHPWRSH